MESEPGAPAMTAAPFAADRMHFPKRSLFVALALSRSPVSTHADCLFGRLNTCAAFAFRVGFKPDMKAVSPSLDMATPAPAPSLSVPKDGRKRAVHA